MLSDTHWHTKEGFHFLRLSVCAFRVVSTSSVLFLSIFTDFTEPAVDSIVFSITKGDNDVIGFPGSLIQ